MVHATKTKYTDKESRERLVVAKLSPIGHVPNGPLMREMVYKYLTFYRGKGVPAQAAEFVGFAPVTDDGYLDMAACKEGEFVVRPGLLYRPIPFFDYLMTQHLKAMKAFRPEGRIILEKDTEAPAVDLGVVTIPKGETMQ